MPDYKKLYFELFNAVTDAVNQLREAQCKSENDYLQMNPPTLAVVSKPEDGEAKSN